MGGLAQVKVRGLAKVRAVFVFAIAAYNIVRLPKLLAPSGRSVSCGVKKEEDNELDSEDVYPPRTALQAKNLTPDRLLAETQ